MSTKLKAGTASSGAVLDADTTGILELQTGSTPTTAIAINASQNVGIGVTPSAWSGYRALQVGGPGTVWAQTSGSGPVWLSNNVYFNGSNRIALNTGTSCEYIQSGTGEHIWSFAPSVSAGSTLTPVERMRIDSSGNLLVGTTTNPNAFKVNIAGTLTASASVSFPQSNNDTTASAANMNIQADGYLRRSTSAAKYKQDIRDLETVDISTFRPVRYKSKCESDDQTIDHFGIIADEVDKAGIKELVNYGADGEVEGFQYERLTVVLLKAIQELKAEVDALKGAK